MAGVGLPKKVFPYYRQVKNGTLVIGLVGFAVTMGNMFVPKPAFLDGPGTLAPQAPATSQQSPWDKQLAPSTTPRVTTGQSHPKTTQRNPFAGSGDGGPFGGGSGSGAFGGGSSSGGNGSGTDNSGGVFGGDSSGSGGGAFGGSGSGGGVFGTN